MPFHNETNIIEDSLKYNHIVFLRGKKKSGKSTLIKNFLKTVPPDIYRMVSIVKNPGALLTPVIRAINSFYFYQKG